MLDIEPDSVYSIDEDGNQEYITDWDTWVSQESNLPEWAEKEEDTEECSCGVYGR